MSKQRILIIVENPYNLETIKQVTTVKTILQKYFDEPAITVCTYEESQEVENIKALEKLAPVQSTALKAYRYQWQSITPKLYDFIITLDFDTAGAFTKAINIQPLFKEFEHFKNIINLNLDKRCVDDNSIMGALLTQLVYLLPKERRYKIDSPNLDVDWFAETFDDISIVFTEKYSDSIEALHKRGMHLATGNSMTPTWSAALLNAAPTIMLCHMFPKKAKDLIQGYEIYLKESKEVRWTTIDINKLINALHLHFTYKLKE